MEKFRGYGQLAKFFIVRNKREHVALDTWRQNVMIDSGFPQSFVDITFTKTFYACYRKDTAEQKITR